MKAVAVQSTVSMNTDSIYVSSGSGVRRTAHTSFVGVQAAFNAVHHAGTANAGQNLLEVEGIGKNFDENGGNHIQVHYNNHQGQQYVQDAHEGNQFFGDADDPFAAADDAVANQYGQDTADDPGGGYLVIEAVDGEGGLQVVGSQQVKAAGVGSNQGYSESAAQASAVQGGFNIIGRAAVAVAVFVPAFVDLRQGAFNEGSGTADDGNQPHPEHGTKAAQAQGSGNPDDVAGAHPGCGGNHQCLERRNGPFFFRFLHDYADALGQPAALNKTSAVSKINTGYQQNNDQNGVIQYVVQRGENLRHCLFLPCCFDTCTCNTEYHNVLLLELYTIKANNTKVF